MQENMYKSYLKLAIDIWMSWIGVGAKGDWDFQISDLIKNPDGSDI